MDNKWKWNSGFEFGYEIYGYVYFWMMGMCVFWLLYCWCDLDRFVVEVFVFWFLVVFWEDF